MTNGITDATIRDLHAQCETDTARLAMANAILRTIVNNTARVQADGVVYYATSAMMWGSDPMATAREWLAAEFGREKETAND
jgi:hypothetical protein